MRWYSARRVSIISKGKIWLQVKILPLCVKNSVIGVFMAEPIADTIAICTTSVMFFRYYKNL